MHKVFVLLCVFVLGAGAALAIARVDGLTNPATVTVTGATVTIPGSVGGPNCTVFLGGTSEAITYVGLDATAECRALIDSSTASAFWTATDPGVSGFGSTRSVICIDALGDNLVRVEDSGGATRGNAACGSLIQQGWRQLF